MLPGVTTDSGVPRLLRRDAQRNREALIAAARKHFAKDGLGASLEQIARTAGVAIGTLYRHFPKREELAVAVFADKLRAVLEAGERGLALDDAWEGFCLFLETLCALQAEDRGFNELSSLDRPATGAAIEVRDRMHTVWRGLLRRAQEQGAVRGDLTFEDMFVLLWSLSRIIDATYGVAPHVWRRHLYLMLDAYRAEKAHLLPEPPLTTEQMARATQRLS